MKSDIKPYLLDSKVSVRQAMKQLDATHRKVLFITDQDNVLIGSLSDGDIRRWILKGGDLDTEAYSACNKKSYSVTEGFDYETVKKSIINEKFSAVPVCDTRGVISEILFWEDILEEEKIIIEYKPIDAEIVIMAGGQGTRLEPFTKILPKPLIPVGDKTIIELIIDKFTQYNVNHFYISINHKAKIIKSYFEELAPAYTIDFVKEDIPLGTVGALSLLPANLTRPVIITNCDIIIDTDYSEFLDFHTKNKYDISLVASLMHHKIPYGICEIESGGNMTDFKEKPEFSFLASTGMYIVNPELIPLIPKNTFFHMTHLMDEVRKKGGRVGVFPISQESWLDTGEWHEYRKTVEKFKMIG